MIMGAMLVQIRKISSRTLLVLFLARRVIMLEVVAITEHHGRVHESLWPLMLTVIEPSIAGFHSFKSRPGTALSCRLGSIYE